MTEKIKFNEYAGYTAYQNGDKVTLHFDTCNLHVSVKLHTVNEHTIDARLQYDYEECKELSNIQYGPEKVLAIRRKDDRKFLFETSCTMVHVYIIFTLDQDHYKWSVRVRHALLKPQ